MLIIRGFSRATVRRQYLHLLSGCPTSSFDKSLQRSHLSTDSSAFPRVAQPSIWQSIIPKAFRASSDPVAVAERQKAKELKALRSKDWNPATFFIVILLLIGSNAIQLIALRNHTLNYSRKAEAKIALLREVIDRVQKGEDVDVEGLLGTGNPEQEREWEEVMKEIESDDNLWEAKRRKRAEKTQKKLQRQSAEQSPATAAEDAASSPSDPEAIAAAARRPGYY